MTRLEKIQLLKDLQSGVISAGDARIRPLDLSVSNLVNISTTDLIKTLEKELGRPFNTDTDLAVTIEELIEYIDRTG